MAFRNLAGEIYRCLHEVCTMTHKLSGVLFTRFTARNQSCLPRNKTSQKLRSLSKIDIIYFPSCVARQIIYSPSCVARQIIYSPSCAARQMAMICGHQINRLPSCVAWQFSQMAMICGEQSSSKSGTPLSCKASINYTPDCDYLASHTCTSNFVELAQIENSHLAMADFDKALPVTTKVIKRKRDREPSRIPVHRVLKLLKRKKVRHKVKNSLIKSVPKNSLVNYVCKLQILEPVV